MSIRLTTALFSAALALAATFFFLSGMSSRDVIHLYARSSVPDVYQVYESAGPGPSGLKSMPNNYFPRVHGAGTVPVSFPVSEKMYQFRIRPGERPAAITIVKVCLERSLFVTRCIDGGSLPGYIDIAHDAIASVNNGELIVECKSVEPYLQFSPRLVSLLRPPADPPLFFVLSLLGLAAAAFLFCFFYSWVTPLAGLWNLAATWVFLGAALIRGCFFVNYTGGAASDSLLFENYLQSHLFVLPGIRGIVYPLFIAMFPPRATALYLTQLLLGALGSVMVLVLMQSVKTPSRWDILWALAATSIPTLVAMEMVELSESLSLFLVLCILFAFRGIQLHRTSIAVAGLGAGCALLYHTKPQFGFMIVLFALLLIFSKLRSLRAVAAFCAPVLALQLLVTVANVSAGNFRGVTSTLGYSLFDHAQQFLTCPGTDPDPRIQYYCNARAAIGSAGNPTGYTAWVIYPAMHGLQELFPQATAGYARLSFHLIATHPLSYARTVSKSFLDFWIDDVPMVPGVLGGRGANWILPLDRLLRRAIEIAFFLSLFAFLFRRARRIGDDTVFCLAAIFTVFGSAAVQALAESGNEQARFAVPTMPLLPIVAVYLAGIIRECLYNKVGFEGLASS